MFLSDKYVYLVSLVPFCILWLLFFFTKPKLRREMVSMSLLIGVASVATSYLWWTKDWWRPATLMGTIVGIEDFVMGFTSGGIMSIVYNFIFNPKILDNRFPVSKLLPIFMIALMTFLTSFIFVFFGVSSFWASLIAMSVTILLIICLRKDLLIDAIVSGIAMLLISILFYGPIVTLSETWIDATYLNGLSGMRLWNVPVEEFVFWFIAGMWVGPFYEVCKGIKYTN